jgi:hypothetical protein
MFGLRVFFFKKQLASISPTLIGGVTYANCKEIGVKAT